MKVQKQISMMERIRLFESRFKNEVIEHETIYTEFDEEIGFGEKNNNRGLRSNNSANMKKISS